MDTLLFTGAGGAGNEAIFRLLQDKYELHFADGDVEAICPDIPVERRHQIPMAKDANFTKAVLDLCKKIGVTLLIPGVDEELLMLAKQAEIPVLLPSPQYVETMIDKYKFIRVLNAKHIAIPATVLAYEKWEEFPCIAKPRSGRGSRNVVVLERAGQLEPYLDFNRFSSEEIILQQKVVGQEYTVLMAADQQTRLHAIVPVKVGLKRGVTIRANVDNNEDVILACRQIHEAIPAKGCYNIQLIHTTEGWCGAFEINPRISTTFCLSLAAGIDPIGIYLNNTPPETLLKGQSGTALKRAWVNHLTIGDTQ